jgi:hypothetical protein
VFDVSFRSRGSRNRVKNNYVIDPVRLFIIPLIKLEGINNCQVLLRECLEISLILVDGNVSFS